MSQTNQMISDYKKERPQSESSQSNQDMPLINEDQNIYQTINYIEQLSLSQYQDQQNKGPVQQAVENLMEEIRVKNNKIAALQLELIQQNKRIISELEELDQRRLQEFDALDKQRKREYEVLDKLRKQEYTCLDENRNKELLAKDQKICELENEIRSLKLKQLKLW
ncbi:Hypothetical_protein [Hexamita inflata]|uniref:Hypothetical_protein n=1 Tax=Hexamita inflata TaxID=28002 RepID=A0ABP1GVY9_9EUKA